MTTTAPAHGVGTRGGRHLRTSVDTPPRVESEIPTRSSSHARPFPWLAVTAGATAIAGGLHLAAAADHLEAGDLVVAFFGLTGFGQLAAAMVLLMPLAGPAAARTRSLLAVAGLLATAALIALYVVVHGTDLLSGLLQHSDAAGHAHTGVEGQVAVSTPAPAGPEPADALGTATVAVEVLALCGFVALLPARWRRPASDGLLVIGGLAWALWLSGALS